MDITINTTCPECKKSIRIYSKCSSESILNRCTSEEELYKFGRMSSLSALKSEENGDFFKDIFKILGEYEKQGSERTLSYVRNHFGRIASKIITTKDQKELLKINKDLTKTKVKVSNKILNEVDKNRKKLLEAVQKKINKSKKSKPKKK